MMNSRTLQWNRVRLAIITVLVLLIFATTALLGVSVRASTLHDRQSREDFYVQAPVDTLLEENISLQSELT